MHTLDWIACEYGLVMLWRYSLSVEKWKEVSVSLNVINQSYEETYLMDNDLLKERVAGDSRL